MLRLLFAGTETGVWVSFDDGDHWQSLQLNLPHTSMRDLLIQGDDLIVATHGRSFWILDDIAPLRQLTEAVASSDAYLFKPAPAYRVPRNTNTDTPIPPDEPAGQNPPDGAIIDYFLPRPATGAVTLEILDSRGNPVRRYASTDPPEMTQAEMEKQLIPLYWIRMPKSLRTGAGMHRWVWDVHYAPPVSTQHDFPISATPNDTPRTPLGPSALPGQYTVRLTVGDHSSSAPITVKMDPRVKTPPNGLEQKFQLETHLASVISESSEAVMQARSLRDQLQKLSGQAGSGVTDGIAALQKKLAAVLGASDSAEATLSRVNSQAGTIYGHLAQSDGIPTIAQINGAAAIEADSAAVMKRWNELKTTDVPQFNHQLKGTGQPELRIEAAPQMGEGGVDRD